MLGREILFFFLITTCYAFFENCDYYEEMKTNKIYYIFSRKYPNKYAAGSSCRWYAVSRPGTVIGLICNTFQIPSSSYCNSDHLIISKTGRSDLADGERYCGKGPISVTSWGNQMSIIFQSSRSSPGGIFLCTIQSYQIQDECDCGRTNQQTRIVGGVPTHVNEFPMMAGLVDGIEKDVYCGATIISQKFALTAAHCRIRGKIGEIALLVGDHDISVGNDTDSARLLMIDRFIVHPEYNAENNFNDIALVRVAKRIEFNKNVGSVCLPFLNTEYDFDGEKVYALGWGSIRFTGPSSPKLMKVKLEIVPRQNCQKYYIFSEKQICAYNEVKDTCQNDSGGPLLWADQKNGKMKLIGIISSGIGCGANYPSVNTRVTHFLDWIVRVTGEKFCVK